MGLAAITAVVVAAQLGELDAGRFATEDPLYAVCPAAPAPVQTDGGWMLPPGRGERNACLMVTCDERRRLLEPLAVDPPLLSSGSLAFDLVLWGLGIGAGMVLGFQLRGLLPR